MVGDLGRVGALRVIEDGEERGERHVETPRARRRCSTMARTHQVRCGRSRHPTVRCARRGLPRCLAPRLRYAVLRRRRRSSLTRPMADAGATDEFGQLTARVGDHVLGEAGRRRSTSCRGPKGWEGTSRAQCSRPSRADRRPRMTIDTARCAVPTGDLVRAGEAGFKVRLRRRRMAAPQGVQASGVHTTSRRPPNPTRGVARAARTRSNTVEGPSGAPG